MSQDPNTAVVLCDAVKGLGVTLDPSHYVCGPHPDNNSFDQVTKYVYHTRLRDTSREGHASPRGPRPGGIRPAGYATQHVPLQ